MRLGGHGVGALAPVIVARNVGGVVTTVRGLVRYTASDGTTGSVALPTIRLGPGQTKQVNAAKALHHAGLGEGDAAVGLEFNYAGAPGSVVMAAYSVGGDGNQVFRVPMLDPSAQKSSTGGYPLVFDHERSTVVYLKNTTDRE